jgi:ribose/xylose/arabinose/galactoside ABC-type transport system permease subunit
MNLSVNRRTLLQLVFNNSTLILFLVVFIVFGLSSPRFFTLENIINFVKQASYTGIIAVGMTFVLLTAGIDLSVGSNMYLSAVISGLLMRSLGLDVLPALLIALLVGTVFGAINAFALVVGVAYLILTRTTTGRQIYAVGNDIEAAKKAGINTNRVIISVYLVSGFCAALAGFILASQVIRVDRSFAEGREFDAIAASVLGGTSLFGGVGNVFGAVVGAVLIQMVQTGLQFNQVNLYLQPMVRAFIIFVTVFFDSLREANQAKLKRRFIRPVESEIPQQKVKLSG